MFGRIVLVLITAISTYFGTVEYEKSDLCKAGQKVCEAIVSKTEASQDVNLDPELKVEEKKNETSSKLDVPASP